MKLLKHSTWVLTTCRVRPQSVIPGTFHTFFLAGSSPGAEQCQLQGLLDFNCLRTSLTKRVLFTSFSSEAWTLSLLGHRCWSRDSSSLWQPVKCKMRKVTSTAAYPVAPSLCPKPTQCSQLQHCERSPVQLPGLLCF